MEDLILIPLLLATFAFGFFIITRVDRCVDESRRRIAEDSRSGKSKVRIAAEDPALLGSVAAALEDCSEAEPHIAFFLSSGRAERLLEKLAEEQIDIALLSGPDPGQMDSRFSVLSIPGEIGAARLSTLGLPIESEENEPWISVVWKTDRRAKDRDRVIFALENGSLGLPCRVKK